MSDCGVGVAGGGGISVEFESGRRARPQVELGRGWNANQRAGGFLLYTECYYFIL